MKTKTEPCQTSKMECLVKTVNGFHLKVVNYFREILHIQILCLAEF